MQRASAGFLFVALFVVACVAAPPRQEIVAPPASTRLSLSSETAATIDVAARPAASELAPTAEPAALPAPVLKGSLSLEEALARRRSVRGFSAKPLTRAELGQLLWAAQGITGSGGRRTAPSAGALYPLEVYVVTAEATYHFEAQSHRLNIHAQGDRRPPLHSAALQQAAVLQAPAVVVIVAIYARTAGKYGEARAARYVHLEAGHVAQNILLQAVALDLGAVPVGAFLDDQVQRALALPPDQQPLYLIPVGHAP